MTLAVVVGLVGLVAIWDSYAYFAWGSDATITYVVREFTRHPLGAFALGVLAGHLL